MGDPVNGAPSPAGVSRPAGAARAGLRAIVAAAVATIGLALPSVALGHQLNARFESPLPLVVYLVGAALAVGLSFTIALAWDVRVLPAGPSAPSPAAGSVPRWARLGLRALGLLAWTWIVVQQLVIGGSSEADVGSLFLWVYGWVGLALVSAFIGPVWSWLDPFTAMYDIGAAILRRLGLRGWVAFDYPSGLGRWPAVAGLVAVIWLELVVTGGGGGSRLALGLVTYTLVTLLAMVVFGRDAWRSDGETFSVWFGVLGRLAPFALDGPPEAGRVWRRPALSGLLGGWRLEELVLIALAVASVLYDGLSQTALYVGWFGLPSLPEATLLLAAWLGLLVGISLIVSRLVGLWPLAAGLLPIAVGYIVAHYLTFILIDGQRILIAISDPFQQGWDLFGTAFFTPGAWFPASLMWAVQLAAVVGGHMVGALVGHDLAVRASAAAPAPAVAALAPAVAGRPARHGTRAQRRTEARRAAADSSVSVRAGPAGSDRAAVRTARMRQVPLAVLMVALTVTTLWSLGQKVVEPAAQASTNGSPPTTTGGSSPSPSP